MLTDTLATSQQAKNLCLEVKQGHPGFLKQATLIALESCPWAIAMLSSFAVQLPSLGAGLAELFLWILASWLISSSSCFECAQARARISWSLAVGFHLQNFHAVCCGAGLLAGQAQLDCADLGCRYIASLLEARPILGSPSLHPYLCFSLSVHTTRNSNQAQGAFFEAVIFSSFVLGDC